MAFENAREAMNEGLDKDSQNQSQSTEASDKAPEAELAPDSGSDASEVEALTTQELIDLDKLDKFKMHGEEWTRDKLASAMLRQADYTRKTQEFSKERKYYENLAWDLENVLKDPSKVQQFKAIYPQKFHQYLEPFASYLKTKPATDGKPTAAQSPDYLELKAELNQIKGTFREQEVKAADVQLDGLFKKYSEKYPYADEASVISRSLALMEQRRRNGETEDLSTKEWDSVFKQENDRVQKLADRKYKETVAKQLNSNRKAKDSAPGGTAMGHAPIKETMKQATERAIRDLSGG
jgi:hypothetical protein